MVNDFEKLRPNVQWISDPVFFNMRSDIKCDGLIDNFTKLEAIDPIIFVPYFAYDFINENRLDEKFNINYVCLGNQSYNYISADLTGSIPLYQTVVQYAITSAIYMGFSEIYLLGCDSTMVSVAVDNLLNKTGSDGHAYKETGTREFWGNYIKHNSIGFFMHDQYNLFYGYRRLKELCDKKGISIYNCSGSTIITEIPRCNLSHILF